MSKVDCCRGDGRGDSSSAYALERREMGLMGQRTKWGVATEDIEEGLLCDFGGGCNEEERAE